MNLTCDSERPAAQARNSALLDNGASTHVRQRLDQLVGGLRRHTLLRGALAMVAAALTTMTALCVVDAVLQPHSYWLRACLTLMGAAILGLAAQWFIRKPLGRERNSLDLAWTLEQEHPEWEERLTSTLLLDSNSGDSLGSRHLIAAVAEQAEQNVTNVDGDMAVHRSAIPSLAGAISSALVLVALLAIWPQHLLPSLSNVFTPWSTRSLPRLSASISPGDTAIAEGESVSVVATGRQLDRAFLEIVAGDTVHSAHSMVAHDNGRRAEFLLSGITEDLTYRVRSSGLYSDDFRIVVRPQPVIQQVTVDLTFPEYTRLAPERLVDPRDLIEAPVGTRVTLSALCAQGSLDALLTLGDESLTVDRVAASDSHDGWSYQWDVDLHPGLDDACRITLVSPHDVRSLPWKVQLRAIDDGPPIVELDVPAQQQLTVHPDQPVPVRFQASDDFGLTVVQLITQKDAAEPIAIPLDLPPMCTDHNGETVVDPSEIKLTPGETLTVWLRVADNRPDSLGGPQWVDSRKVQILVSEQAPPFATQVIRDQAERIDQRLDAAVEKLQTSSELARELAKSLDDALRDPDEARQDDQALADQATQLRQEIDAAKQTLDELRSEDEAAAELFQPQLDSINDVAEQEVAEAQRQAQGIQLNDDAKQQGDHAKTAQELLDQATDTLKQVQAELRQRREDLQLAAQVDRLAHQQQRLAEKRGQQDEETARPQQPEQQKQQEKVARELRELVAQDPQAQNAQMQRRADRAKRLANLAKDLQQQQEKITGQHDPEAAKLQERIAERTQQLREEAERLVNQPTDEEEVAKAVQRAARDLLAAQQNTRRAEEMARREQQDAGEKLEPKQRQTQSSPQEPDQQVQPQDAQAEQPDAAPRSQPTQQAAKQRGAQGAQQEQEPGQQRQPKNTLAKQQEQAAQALRNAASSLDKVCKSCRQCAECSNPSQGSEAATPVGQQSSGRQSGRPPATANGRDAAAAQQPADHSNSGAARPGNERSKKLSEQLAKAADQVTEAAKSPSQQSTAAAANEVNKLADQLANESGYPYRATSKPATNPSNDAGTARNSQQHPPDRPATGEGQSAQQGTTSQGPPNAHGQDPNADETTPVIGLRGGSTSNWTRSRKQLRGNVLSDKHAAVPEQFREVVEAYFEELSRIDSRPAVIEDAER